MRGKIAFSGIPHKWVENEKCSPTKGNKIRSTPLTLAFSGAKRRKIRIGYLTPAFSGTHKGGGWSLSY